MKFVEYSLNGISFRANKIFIQESKGLLDKLKPKPRKAYDWAEQHGKTIDLSAPKYEERVITLKGWVQGDDWQEMKQNFDRLMSEFDKEGLARLIVNFGKELVYDVYLADGVELEKKFDQGKQVGFFTLKMKEPRPVKKVLKLQGNTLTLSCVSMDWVNINIDGENQTLKGNINLAKNLPNGTHYIVISGNVEQINNLETNAEVIWN